MRKQRRTSPLALPARLIAVLALTLTIAACGDQPKPAGSSPATGLVADTIPPGEIPAVCAQGTHPPLVTVQTNLTLAQDAALRTWLIFNQTAGLDGQGLLLEADFPRPMARGPDTQQYRATFELDGHTVGAALPWVFPSSPTTSVSHGLMTISNVRAGDVMTEVFEYIAPDPCLSYREVAVTVENTDAQTRGIPGLPYGVDRAGRVYEGEFTSGDTLNPRETREITLRFPAILGMLDQPAALLFIPDGNSDEDWLRVDFGG
ncbi:MAG: hypothetical protein RLZZ387_1625 [Chloroflexota bacterium]